MLANLSLLPLSKWVVQLSQLECRFQFSNFSCIQTNMWIRIHNNIAQSTSGFWAGISVFLSWIFPYLTRLLLIHSTNTVIFFRYDLMLWLFIVIGLLAFIIQKQTHMNFSTTATHRTKLKWMCWPKQNEEYFLRNLFPSVFNAMWYISVVINLSAARIQTKEQMNLSQWMIIQ